MKGPPTKLGYGYIRVSTAYQKESGVSLEAQIDAINSWAEKENILVIKIFKDEGLSGRRVDKRDDFKQLLNVVKKGQIIITYSLSRISRSTKQSLEIFETLEKKGVEIFCLKERFDTSTAAGKLFFRMMAAIAEFEADVVEERTKNTIAFLQSQDRAIGKCPYGWKKASKMRGSGLIEVPEEQEIIQLILDKRERDICEPTSWHIIAKELNEEKIPPPPKAKMWYKSTVKRIAERSFDVKTLGRDGLIHYEEPVTETMETTIEEQSNNNINEDFGDSI